VCSSDLTPRRRRRGGRGVGRVRVSRRRDRRRARGPGDHELRGLDPGSSRVPERGSVLCVLVVRDVQAGTDKGCPPPGTFGGPRRRRRERSQGSPARRRRVREGRARGVVRDQRRALPRVRDARRCPNRAGPVVRPRGIAGADSEADAITVPRAQKREHAGRRPPDDLSTPRPAEDLRWTTRDSPR